MRKITPEYTDRIRNASNMKAPIVSGIYRIHNTVSGKCYVGSSCDLAKRLKAHFYLLKRGVSPHRKLQNAYQKYGQSAFVGVELEECERNELPTVEQKWIRHFDSVVNGYNFSDDTECAVRGTHPTEESRQHMSQAQLIEMAKPERREIASKTMSETNKRRMGVPISAEHKQQIGQANRGKVRSEQVTNRMRQPMIDNPMRHWLGKKRSAEDRKKMSDGSKRLSGSQHPRSKPIVQYSLTMQPVGGFVSVAKVAKDLGLQRTGIGNCLAGRSETCGGFIFKYR